MAKQQQRPQQGKSPQTPQGAQVKRSVLARRSENPDSIFAKGRDVLIFGRRNYILFVTGLVLVLLGLALMSGGSMPDPNKWQPEVIYSFQRITLAPILMVAGFVVLIWGIFAKPGTAQPIVEADFTQEV